MNFNDFDKTTAYGELSALAKTWKFDFPEQPRVG
jgi:hypothetical protein